MPGIITQAVNLISEGLGRQYGIRTAKSDTAARPTGADRTDSRDGGEETKSITQNDVLGKDAFFKLLITQLKYQDPLKPMENKEFIAQMAQFSSLEHMQNMNQNMDKYLKLQGLAEGASLIGKTVKTTGTGDEGAVSGRVTQVSFNDGDILVHLEDGQKVKMEDIETVYL